VPRSLEVIVDEFVGAGMQWQIARLLTLAGDFEMRYAAPCLTKIPDPELAQLLAPQRVIEQGRQDGAVALLFLFDGFFAGLALGAGRDEEVAGLVVAERRRLAFAALGLGALDAFDRIVGDGVLLAQIFEQRPQRRQAMPDRGATLNALSAAEVVAPDARRCSRRSVGSPVDRLSRWRPLGAKGWVAQKSPLIIRASQAGSYRRSKAI
jgi:hypothetical protein